MDFEEAINSILGLFGFNRAEEAEEVGTTQPPLYSEEDRQLQYQLGDTEMLADIYNAQRTRENPQVELGARYMDNYRTKVPGGLATLMFQPHTSAFGSASPAGSMYNTSGTNYHQIKLKSLEDLEKAGYAPERRDRTIFHELGHIGEFITDDLIRAGVIPPFLASDYGMMGTIGGLGDGDLAHSALHTMDDHYGKDQMRGRIPRGENLGPKSKTYDEIQAEINAEMKRIGEGNWNSTLDKLVAQRDRAKASPNRSIEVTDEEAKNPTEQILDAIFGKDKVAGLQAGFNRHYLESPKYTKENSPDSTQEEIDAANERIKRLNDYRTEQYGFDVTDFWENSEKMVDNMKRHTRAANELAEMIIEDYPFGYIKEKVTDGY